MYSPSFAPAGIIVILRGGRKMRVLVLQILSALGGVSGREAGRREQSSVARGVQVSCD